MKKIVFIILIVCLIFSLSSCEKTYKGTDELMNKAREELKVSYGDSVEMKYAGSCTKDSLELLWFIAGNEYQGYSYLPMECNIVGEDEYTFVTTYKPMDRGEDIAVLQWKDSYCYLINNRNCKTLRIKKDNGTYDFTIEEDAYPYKSYFIRK